MSTTGYPDGYPFPKPPQPELAAVPEVPTPSPETDEGDTKDEGEA